MHVITLSKISDKTARRRQFLNLPQPTNSTDYLHGTIASTDLVKWTFNKEVVPDVLSTTATPKILLSYKVPD